MTWVATGWCHLTLSFIITIEVDDDENDDLEVGVDATDQEAEDALADSPQTDTCEKELL